MSYDLVATVVLIFYLDFPAKIGGFALQITVYMLVLLSAAFSLTRMVMAKRASNKDNVLDQPNTTKVVQVDERAEADAEVEERAAVYHAADIEEAGKPKEQFQSNAKWFCALAGMVVL